MQTQHDKMNQDIEKEIKQHITTLLGSLLFSPSSTVSCIII